MKQYPDHDVLPFRLGNVLVRQAKWQEAFSSYSEAIRLNPRNWEALASRANVLMKLNRQKEALADFRQVLKINPNYSPARQAISVIEKQQRP
jgi:cytochrome c-type biogenesis protein CcmH/NrfG